MPKLKSQNAIAIVALAVAAFVVAFLSMRLDSSFEVVDQEYVKAHVGRPGFILLDVREANVYNGASPFEGVPGGHIPGAVNFPSSKLKLPTAIADLALAGATKDLTIIVHCNAGRLSSQFAEALVKDLGYSSSKIKNYKGSMIDWSKNPDNVILPEGHETGLSGDKRPAIS